VLRGWSVPSAGVASTAHSRLAPTQRPGSQSSGDMKRQAHEVSARVQSAEGSPIAGNLPRPPPGFVPDLSSGKTSPLFIRRDASARSTLNIAVQAEARQERPLTRGASEARSAFLGNPSSAQSRNVDTSNSTLSRSRKAYLSDDSSPEIPRPLSRGSVDSSVSRFPTAVQLHSMSHEDSSDNGLSKARNSGMTSPIRRRDVSGLGQTARGGSRQSPKMSSAGTLHSLYAPAEQRGKIFSFCLQPACVRMLNIILQVVRKMLPHR
jgi:hypothetical protein